MTVDVVGSVDRSDISIWDGKGFAQTGYLSQMQLRYIFKYVFGKRYRHSLAYFIVIQLHANSHNENVIFDGVTAFGGDIILGRTEASHRIFDPFRIAWQHILHGAR